MLKWDIRYTHFGGNIDMKYRSSGDYPNFPMLKRQKDDRQLRREILRNAQKNYTNPDLPPAPAFRILSRYEVDEIVDRMQTRYTPRPRTSTKPTEEETKKSKIYGAKKMSASQLAEVTKRLDRPTTVTVIRNTQTSVEYPRAGTAPVPVLGRRAQVNFTPTEVA